MSIFTEQQRYPGETILPDAAIDSFSLTLSRPEEKAFVHGCQALIKGNGESARLQFRRATEIVPDFQDAWFMIGFIELSSGRVERARQAFLHILRDDKPFNGIYILRFLPTIRLHVNLFEDFLFQIMPTTPEVAAAMAGLYMVENRTREAKKIVHPAFREYPDNTAVKVMWSRMMLADGAPDVVIEEVDRRVHVHKGKREVDILLTHLIGQAFIDKGDFRSAVAHWESIFHHASDKNPRLIDRFRILLAIEYEKKGYLIDVIDTLRTVSDSTMAYDENVSVEFKRGELVEKIKAYRRQDIKVPLQYQFSHELKRADTTHGFLEMEGA